MYNAINSIVQCARSWNVVGAARAFLCPGFRISTIMVSPYHILPQALDKHINSPLSSSKSTRNVRVASETNGRYVVKTGIGLEYCMIIIFVHLGDPVPILTDPVPIMLSLYSSTDFTSMTA